MAFTEYKFTQRASEPFPVSTLYLLLAFYVCARSAVIMDESYMTKADDVYFPACDKSHIAGIAFTGSPTSIREGLELYKRGVFGRLRLSGYEFAHMSATDIIEDAGLESSSFDLSRISIDRMSSDTRGQAIESAAWLAQGNVCAAILITHNAHMPRALYLTREKASEDGPALPIAGYTVDNDMPRSFKEFGKYLVTVNFGIESDPRKLIQTPLAPKGLDP